MFFLNKNHISIQNAGIDHAFPLYLQKKRLLIRHHLYRNREVGKEIGSFKFLLIYFVSGIGANLISLAMDFYTGNLAVSAGASGAIFGLLGALLWVVIRNRGKVGRLTGRGMLFMVLLSLYFGFTSTGVDNAAHVGGLICGFLTAVLWYHGRNVLRQEV